MLLNITLYNCFVYLYKKDFIIIIKYVKIYISFEFKVNYMHFKVDELLLLENLTYLDNIPPLFELSKFSGKTIKEVLDELDLSNRGISIIKLYICFLIEGE